MIQSSPLRVGVLPLARNTFDVPFAEAMSAKAFAALASRYLVVGSPNLLFDADATRSALDQLGAVRIDLLLILQVTFSDATMAIEIARAASAPLAIWAMPEPRAGGRLRLNSFCGMNLAMHALGRAGLSARALYAAPDDSDIAARLAGLTSSSASAGILTPASLPTSTEQKAAAAAITRVAGTKIAVIGEHPAGFDTCRYDAVGLAEMFKVDIEQFPLTDVFERAKNADESLVGKTRAALAHDIDGLESVDQPQLDRSLRVYEAMRSLANDKNCAALAVRCWPEMFTDYGCAACGPAGLLADGGIPCACEADVLGTLTSLILQEIAGTPPWLVDIVDMDGATDTSIFWHCGSAPLSMAGGSFRPRAQVHSNRRMPLLAEFTLKPGRITIARVSQARNVMKLVVSGAEIIDAPLSFTGTSATVRFDRPADEVSERIMAETLEHHIAFVYGEHRGTLRALAAMLGLPVLELA